MRSLLFVPGDSARKFERARQSGADALILDLEDSVASEAKTEARAITRAMLESERGNQHLFVRVNALDTGLTLADLAAVMAARPDGIVLPKCASGADIQRLAHYLDAFEAAAGLSAGETRIIGIVTETAASLFGLGSYRDGLPRLAALMWGAEDLAASLGATENGDAVTYHPPFQLARNLCLMAAAAAGLVAIDTVCTAIDDLDRVTLEARTARRDGFLAKAVIHPKHVACVNAAFTPSAEEVAWSRQVVDLFASTPNAGVLKLAGKMLDKPHLRAAERILATADPGAYRP
jgi:citrate lyase subunit beta / citryl-CoA lyase